MHVTFTGAGRDALDAARPRAPANVGIALATPIAQGRA